MVRAEQHYCSRSQMVARWRTHSHQPRFHNINPVFYLRELGNHILVEVIQGWFKSPIIEITKNELDCIRWLSFRLTNSWCQQFSCCWVCGKWNIHYIDNYNIELLCQVEWLLWGAPHHIRHIELFFNGDFIGMCISVLWNIFDRNCYPNTGRHVGNTITRANTNMTLLPHKQLREFSIWYLFLHQSQS